MYLTRMYLDYRSRGVRRDVADPGELHRTLMRAFPDGVANVRARYDILYRLDALDSEIMLYVQSAVCPVWSRLPCGFLAIRSDALAVKEFNPQIPQGAILQFKLRANPTKKRDNKRIFLCSYKEQIKWLAQKGEQCGFRLEEVNVVGKLHTSGTKSGNGGSITTEMVDYAGVLTVSDAQRFGRAVSKGVGPAKAYGCGMLILAKVKA